MEVNQPIGYNKLCSIIPKVELRKLIYSIEPLKILFKNNSRHIENEGESMYRVLEFLKVIKQPPIERNKVKLSIIDWHNLTEFWKSADVYNVLRVRIEELLVIE